MTRRSASARPVSSGPARSTEDKLRLVLAAERLGPDQRSAFLRRECVRAGDLEGWRAAMMRALDGQAAPRALATAGAPHPPRARGRERRIVHRPHLGDQALLRRRTQALGSLGARYQRLVDSGLIGVAIGRLDGTLEQVNEAFLAMLGYTRADFRGGQVQWRRMTPPEWKHVDEAVIAYQRATGFTGNFEKEYIRKDGSRVAVLLGSAFLEEKAERFIYYAIDISARKQAEAELARVNASLEQQVAARTAELATANRQLRESLALIDTLFQTAPIGLAFVDRDLRYVRIDDQLADIHGASVEAHLGRGLQEVIPGIAPHVIEHYRSVLATGRPVVDLEVSGARPSAPGERCDWLVSYYPVRLEGETLGVGVVVQDITDRKRAERERGRLLDEARQALRARDVFAAVASHELKTPLTPLRLNLEALRGELAPTGAAERWLPRMDLVLRQVDRLTSLVDALLAVAQGSSAMAATTFVDTDLTALTREVLARFAPVAAQARCPVTLQATGPAVAAVDPSRIEQVLQNLLANALRFGAGRAVTVSVLPGPGSVRLVVEDQGLGIRPEDQSRIFGLFERAADERRYGGLGLGLYIAARIVEAHGGTITCSSAPGDGARFEVELPSKQPRTT